jgi:hypothetical protein
VNAVKAHEAFHVERTCQGNELVGEAAPVVNRCLQETSGLPRPNDDEGMLLEVAVTGPCRIQWSQPKLSHAQDGMDRITS